MEFIYKFYFLKKHSIKNFYKISYWDRSRNLKSFRENIRTSKIILRLDDFIQATLHERGLNLIKFSIYRCER